MDLLLDPRIELLVGRGGLRGRGANRRYAQPSHRDGADDASEKCLHISNSSTVELHTTAHTDRARDQSNPRTSRRYS
jgi:hypothetical protein